MTLQGAQQKGRILRGAAFFIIKVFEGHFLKKGRSFEAFCKSFTKNFYLFVE